MGETVSKIEKFRELTQKMVKIFEEKNQKYGESFFTATDLKNAYWNLERKLTRFKVQAESPERSGLTDFEETLLDMANYCLMTLILIEKLKREKLPKSAVDKAKVLEISKVKEIHEKYGLELRLYLGEKPKTSFLSYEHIRVRLISYTENWLDAMYQVLVSMGTCAPLEAPREKKIELLKREQTATAPFEAVSLTFVVENVSRAVTHQMVRHRRMSFGQESFRITDIRHHPVRALPGLTEESSREYVDAVLRAKEAYAKLVDAGVPLEHARYVMPMGTLTYITLTCSLRDFIDYLNARLQEGAMDEHRVVAKKMLDEVYLKLPELYEIIKPKLKWVE